MVLQFGFDGIPGGKSQWYKVPVTPGKHTLRFFATRQRQSDLERKSHTLVRRSPETDSKLVEFTLRQEPAEQLLRHRVPAGEIRKNVRIGEVQLTTKKENERKPRFRTEKRVIAGLSHQLGHPKGMAILGEGIRLPGLTRTDSLSRQAELILQHAAGDIVECAWHRCSSCWLVARQPMNRSALHCTKAGLTPRARHHRWKLSSTRTC